MAGVRVSGGIAPRILNCAPLSLMELGEEVIMNGE
jgi:hypothetical protein